MQKIWNAIRGAAGLALLSLCVPTGAQDAAANLRFPTEQPERASYTRPNADQKLDISPPGFCW